MDNTTTYFEWQRALMHDEILRKLATKSEWDIRYTALIIASYHTDHSWVSAKQAAEDIGCSLDTVKRHRTELISLGWFTEISRNRRQVTVAIAIPGSADQLHDTSTTSERCTAEPRAMHPDASLRDAPSCIASSYSSYKNIVVSNSDALHAPLNSESLHDSQEENTRDALRASLASTTSNADVTEEKIKGPWCTGCDVPLVSNDQDHNEGCKNCGTTPTGIVFKDGLPCCPHCDRVINHQYVCTSCGTIDKIELSFSRETGKAWYKCSSCNVFLVTKQDVLIAKVWKMK